MSEKVKELYKAKPWQGADPFKAKYLFVGRDANFAENVDRQIPEIIEYLMDGPAFWRKEALHHPFRLRRYLGAGKTYHDRFAEIGFCPSEADQVSFVELFHLPTEGNNNNIQVADLLQEHLAWLNKIFDEGQAKYIFTFRFVVDLMRESDQFSWLPNEPLQTDGDLKVLLKDTGEDQVIYQMYHFSCRRQHLEKLRRQIDQIRYILAKERSEEESSEGLS